MRVRHVAAATIAFVVLAGCSGGDDSADTTVSPTSSTDPGVTTEMTTTPTVESSTTAVTTTVATTQPETTTSQPESTTTPTSPSTTTDPSDSVTDLIAVVDVVENAWQSSLEALRDPTADEKRKRLGEFYTGTLLEGFQNLVDRYREQNYRTIENPSEPDSLQVELASLAVNEQGTFATVQACDVTAGIVIEVGGNPDGSDRVVDDRIGRVVIEFEVVKVDGTWKVETGREPEESERIASCA